MSSLHRNPGITAKAAATIGEISGGRFILGLGAGHPGSGAQAFGLPEDHIYQRFEEALEIVVPLLRTGRAEAPTRIVPNRQTRRDPSLGAEGRGDPRAILAAMEVAEGIHKVEGTWVGNAYLLQLDDGLLVVDTGMPGRAGRILECVGRLGLRPGDIRIIVLTHWHPDHMGSAAELRSLTGATIAIHELDAAILAGGERPPKGRRTMGALLRLFRVRPVVADTMLVAGDVVGGLEVIHVPGHTAGSIALRRGDGVVFSGDALLGDRRGEARPPDPGLSLDPALASESAARLLALQPRLLLPGHGAPVRGLPAAS
jgi:glyoxylase-like metal-dependent hydrolase (beta-lactamase superfamily II)